MSSVMDIIYMTYRPARDRGPTRQAGAHKNNDEEVVSSKILWSLSPEGDPGLLVRIIELDDNPVAGVGEIDDVGV
jgi:hypothetical protein